MTLQLSVRGEQDVYISGKPSITYFSSIYKKTTPFVSEYVEYPFDSLITGARGGTGIITIPSKGDIITDICLRNIFSKLYPSSLIGYYYGKIATKVFNVYAVTTSGTVVLILQTVVTGSYYSTLRLYTWSVPQVTDVSIAYVDTRFVFSTQNSTYNTLSFKDEDSASFFGFDIISPTAPSVGTGIIASYKFLSSGYTDAQFALAQASIVAAASSFCLVSQDSNNNIYIITGAETIQKYNILTGTAGTIYSTGLPATYTLIMHTATDFNNTLYVSAWVNSIVTSAVSRIISINITTGVATQLTDNLSWGGGYFQSLAYVNGNLFFTIDNDTNKTIRCLTNTSFSTNLGNAQRLRGFPGNPILYASNGNLLYAVNTTSGATTLILDAKDNILDFMPTVNSIFVSYGSHTTLLDYVTTKKLTINRYDLNGQFMSNYTVKTGVAICSLAYLGTTIYATLEDNSMYSKYITAGNVPVYLVTSGLTLEQSGWVPGFAPTVNIDGTNPYTYTDSYSLSVIKEARLYLGNQLISRISGDYIKILKDYETGYENRAGLNIINGMGDTSIKYTQAITLASLPFGIKNLPVTATYHQSTQVQIDFNDISTVLNAPTSNPLYLSSSYSITQISNVLSVPTFQAQNVYSYSNTLVITENTLYVTFFDLNKDIRDATAYTRKLNNNGLIFSSVIIDGYMYNYNGYSATRLLLTDYVTMTGSAPTTSTITIWPYGNPASYKVMSILNDSRYIYYALTVSSEKLSTTGNYATITSYTNVGGGFFNVQLTFFGVTTANSNGAHAEVVGRVAGRQYSNASGYSTYSWGSFLLYSESTDGTNCYVSVRWAFGAFVPIERIFGTISIVRYDTTADFNSRSSYTFSNDFSNIFLPKPGLGVGELFPPAYPTVSVNTLRAFIDNFNIYVVTTAQYVYSFTTEVLYIVNIANFTSSYCPTYVGGLSLPYFNDGSYIYFSVYNSGTISRFKINTSPDLGSSWQTFDLYANFSSIFNFASATINQFSPGAFDGRYVYYSGTLTSLAASPIILKYDTTKLFTLANSYSVVMRQQTLSNNFVTDTGSVLNVNFTNRYSPNSFVFNRQNSTSQILGITNNISNAAYTNQITDIFQINTAQLDETYTFTPTILVEYAYIDTPEQQFFRKYQQTIVYETLQTNKFVVKPGMSSLPLQFLNPTKQIYIYSNTYSNINSFQMLFNGETLFTLDNTYLRSVEPIELSKVTPVYNTYLYDFEFPVNMSRIGTKSLTIDQGTTATIFVHAKTLNVLVIKDGLTGLLFNSLEYIV
jgi:hypothetical protein